MLACYCLQGKQLASGVIGLLTCHSHYNVSVINTTPCARLLSRHLLEQRIPTQPCEWQPTHTPAGLMHRQYLTHTHMPDTDTLFHLNLPDQTMRLFPLRHCHSPRGRTHHRAW